MLTKKETSMSMRSEAFIDDASSTFDNITIPDPENIPEILKGESKMKVVDGEAPLLEDTPEHDSMLSASFKLIDTDLTMQIINGPNADPRMQLNIKKVKQLGGGA